MNFQALVRDFMKKAEQATPSCVTVPERSIRILRVMLLAEELVELAKASGIFCRVNVEGLTAQADPSADASVDMVEVADALADLQYVLSGASVAYGINLEPIFMEVHYANMEKFGPGSYKREDGKFMKPPDWQPPDIKKLLEIQGWSE